jgi:hypothetical protein
LLHTGPVDIARFINRTTEARAVWSEAPEEAARIMDETGSTDLSRRIREMKRSGTTDSA